MSRNKAVLAFLVAVALVTAPVMEARAEDQEGCLLCHGLDGLGYVSGGAFRSLYVNSEEFNSSRHNQLSCRACHRDIVAVPHDLGKRVINCGLECHAVDPATSKPYSHEALYWNFMASVHGKNAKNPITCLDCHPRNPSPQEKRTTMEEKADRCAGCHFDRARASTYGWNLAKVATYFRDVHGRVASRGGHKAPSCSECHTLHSVLPAANEESSVNPKKVGATCAGSNLPEEKRSCHRAASTAKLLGMSPLRGRGWPDYPGGTLFLVLGMLLSVMLGLRMLLGLKGQR